MRAIFVLTPPESKRFIAKAVVKLPEVKKAWEEGEIVIGHGSTNVRVVEELLGEFPDREKFISGQVINGILCVTAAEEKLPMVVIRRGKIVGPQPTMEDTLRDFDAHSVFIKGANAVDKKGRAGVFVAHPSGGTIGFAYGILYSRGSPLIVPVGLEKLVPSVRKAAQRLGQTTLDYSTGIKVGMIPLINAQVITEIDAFHVLFDLGAIHVGSGGLNGSEGAVSLVVEGEKTKLDPAIRLIESIKGEPRLNSKKSLCINCLPTSPGIQKSPNEQFAEGEAKHCMYRGKQEINLPHYMKRE